MDRAAYRRLTPFPLRPPRRRPPRSSLDILRRLLQAASVRAALRSPPCPCAARYRVPTEWRSRSSPTATLPLDWEWDAGAEPAVLLPQARRVRWERAAQATAPDWVAVALPATSDPAPTPLLSYSTAWA